MDFTLSGVALGLAIAIAPTLMTTAYQTTSARRQQKVDDAAEYAGNVRAFTGACRLISLNLPFTQAHAYAATQLAAVPAVLIGTLQPFDLYGMQRLYAPQFAVALETRAWLLARAPEAAVELINEVMDLTAHALSAYMGSDDVPRARIRRWLSPLPPLDREKADDVIRQQGRAIELLEATLARSSR